MIERSIHASTAVLHMAHGKANALDLEFLRALDDALRAEEQSPATAVVLTGQGSIFSAGVDLVRVIEGRRRYLEQFLPALDACLLRMWTFRKPLVAALNGHAIAGGCIFACACDVRVLARGKASYGVPELKVGVPFPLIPLEITRHAFGPANVLGAILSGRLFSAEECLDHGLVDELCDAPQLLERALARAAELAALPAASFAHTKRLLRLPLLDAHDRHGARAAAETLAIWTSDEVLRAIEGYVARTLRK